MPEPKKEHYNGMALNCEEAPLDVDIKDGGKVVVLNTKNLPLVGEVGLGAILLAEWQAMCSQVSLRLCFAGHVYCEGSGRFRFFVVSKIADPDGMDWFSIISTPNPVFTHLAGRTSVWKSLSPEVLQASFGVPPDVSRSLAQREG
ncbi:UNVERIFIED_CONTAM: hypothetical protein Slati_3124100 [Sesamum latifolium]|uniref:Uncharacterized protein n=1 Tax=Sesamum latifolium TaxID=2727402 RepID=A0AAW2UW19_9LAMI